MKTLAPIEFNDQRMVHISLSMNLPRFMQTVKCIIALPGIKWSSTQKQKAQRLKSNWNRP